MNNGVINDIASLVGSGITPLRSNNKYWDMPCYPWLKTEQLGDFQIFDTSEYISQTALEETNIKLWPPKTLSVAMYGEGQTRGNVSIIMREMTTNQACCNIVVDESKADYRYVYYWLKNSYQQLRILASGVRKNLNSDDIKSFPISYPSVPLQTRIADILFRLDEKIALNKRINAELETLAKTIYDYWFVQFNFPDENGKPYRTSGGPMEYNEQLKREIPKGWKVKDLKHFLLLLKDGTHNPPKRIKVGVPLLTGTMFGAYFIDLSKATYIAKADYDTIHSQYAPQKGDLIITKIGTLGNVNYLREEDLPIAIHCNSALLRFPNEYNEMFALQYLKSTEFFSRLKAVKGQSIQEFCSLDRIGSIPILLPTQNLVCRYNQLMSVVFKEMQRTMRENDELTRLRDWLLPMLMNGQATVADKQPTEVPQNVVEMPGNNKRFNLWLQNQGIAARGDLDKKTLREIFDAMDDDDK